MQNILVLKSLKVHLTFWYAMISDNREIVLPVPEGISKAQ